jgi:hypothetical protein
MRRTLITLLAGVAMTLPAMATQSGMHHRVIHHTRHHEYVSGWSHMHSYSRPYTNPANALGHY